LLPAGQLGIAKPKAPIPAESRYVATARKLYLTEQRGGCTVYWPANEGHDTLVAA
jgi:hypothetical protein